MGPQILHWVKFGSVAGKILQPQTSFCWLYELPYRTAAVTRQSIPDDQQRTANLAQQGFRNSTTCGTLDRSRKQAEVEIPEGQAGHGRQASSN